MELTPTAIPGCLAVHAPIFEDQRGTFVKTYHQGAFEQAGVSVTFAEQYCSTSGRGIIRGLHFQTPPHEHAKLVYCLSGTVFDVVLDLRRGSPTFGQTATFKLDPAGAAGLFIPPGLAHGFQALTSEALMLYNVTSMHAPEHDQGVRWDSCGIQWPLACAGVSSRDASFPALSEFNTPFNFMPVAVAHVG